MYYIKNGLSKHWHWLAFLFSLFGVLTVFGTGNATQVNTIVTAIDSLMLNFNLASSESLSTINLVIGIIIAIGFLLAVLYALRRTGFSSLLPVEGYTRRQAEVAGVFAADAQTDGRYLFTSLRLAQELFSYPDRASAAVVRVARGARPEEVKRRVAEAAGGAFEVRTRDELNASFYTIMQYEKWGIFLISLLVLVIASFSIVGTVVMLVLDKRPEFVALGAMGADTRFVRRIFFFEGGLIGVLGAGAGVVLGVGLCLVQHYFGVIEIPADSFLVKSYPVLLRGGDVAAVVAAFAVVVGAMTAVTVRRAVRADDMAAGRTAQ